MLSAWLNDDGQFDYLGSFRRGDGLCAYGCNVLARIDFVDLGFYEVQCAMHARRPVHLQTRSLREH